MTPQFETFADFAAMGGHSAYVFGAWGLSISLIILLIVRAILTGRRQKDRLKALESDPSS